MSLALLRFVIGPENSRHSLNQSAAKLKPTTTWLPAFSRALGNLFILSWILIGSSGYFPFFWSAVVQYNFDLVLLDVSAGFDSSDW